MRAKEAYINYHADSRQGGRKVLRVRRSDVDGNTSSIEAAVEGGDQINACGRDGRRSRSEKKCLINKYMQKEKMAAGTHWEDKAAPRSLQC